EMTVFSRVHILLENVNADTGQKMNEHPMLDALQNAPAFVVQDDALELLKRADCGAAIAAMHEAGILRLPYSRCVIEFEFRKAQYGKELDRLGHLRPSDDQPLHEFVLLEEKDGKIEAQYAFLYCRDRIGGIGEFVINVTANEKGFMF